MVGANVKSETMALMDQRTAMEQEMNGIIQRLCRPGGPGLSGNLVDKEGFPRADIDISATRTDRQRLSALRNDHSAITGKIEKNLHVLHAKELTLPQKRNAEGEQVHRDTRAPPVETHATPTPMDEDEQSRAPFAVFDQVEEGSPAALDGIRVGDQLLKFGSVQGPAQDSLRRLAIEGQRSENQAVPVVVLRRGVQERLIVTPRRWSGNGLLGCHLQPL